MGASSLVPVTMGGAPVVEGHAGLGLGVGCSPEEGEKLRGGNHLRMVERNKVARVDGRYFPA